MEGRREMVCVQMSSQMCGIDGRWGQGQTEEASNMVGMSHRPASPGEEMDKAFFKLFENVSVAEPWHLPEGQFGRT